MRPVRERFERVVKDPEEAAYCIEALFKGGDADDPDASYLGALILADTLLRWR